ncbi:MAG: hypothetical protein AAB401_03965 [Acidobacteriota bacterium]
MKIPINYPGFEGRGLTLYTENLYRRHKIMLDGRALVSTNNECFLARNNNGDQVIIRVDYNPHVPNIFIDGEKADLNLALDKSDAFACLLPMVLCISGPLWTLVGIAISGLSFGIYRSELAPRIKRLLFWTTIWTPIAAFLYVLRSLENPGDIVGW